MKKNKVLLLIFSTLFLSLSNLYGAYLKVKNQTNMHLELEIEAENPSQAVSTHKTDIKPKARKSIILKPEEALSQVRVLKNGTWVSTVYSIDLQGAKHARKYNYTLTIRFEAHKQHKNLGEGEKVFKLDLERHR